MLCVFCAYVYRLCVWSDETVTLLTIIHETNRNVSITVSIVWRLTGALLKTKSSRCVLFFCSGSKALTGELAPPAVYLHQPTNSYSRNRTRWKQTFICIFFWPFYANWAIICIEFEWTVSKTGFSLTLWGLARERTTWSSSWNMLYLYGCAADMCVLHYSGFFFSGMWSRLKQFKLSWQNFSFERRC